MPGATPVQHIRHAPDGERVFERYDEGVLGGFRVSARQREAIAASDVLATAAFGQGLTFFESVLACRPSGLRAVDFTNANDVGDPVAFAERWAPELDVGLFGLQRADAALIDALEAVAQRSGRLFVVTLGPAGALALGRREPASPARRTPWRRSSTRPAPATPSPPASCASTRAAGDVARSLARGSEVAAATLGHLGSFELPDSAMHTIRPRGARRHPRGLRGGGGAGRHRARSASRSTGSASRATSGSSASPRPGATRRSSRP